MTGFDAWILDDDDDARRAENAIAIALARTSRIVDNAVLISWPATARQSCARRRTSRAARHWATSSGSLPRHRVLRPAAGRGQHRTDSAWTDSEPSGDREGRVPAGRRVHDHRRARPVQPGPADRPTRRRRCIIVLSDGLTSERIGAALTPHGWRHIHASASDDQLARLQEIFGRWYR